MARNSKVDLKLEKDVFKIVKDINIAKSSGLDNVSSLIVKEAFRILIPEVNIHV